MAEQEQKDDNVMRVQNNLELKSQIQMEYTRCVLILDNPFLYKCDIVQTERKIEYWMYKKLFLSELFEYGAVRTGDILKYVYREIGMVNAEQFAYACLDIRALLKGSQ